MRWTTLHGDSLVLLPLMPANSVDALVCDPPAGIQFMNRAWDSDRGGKEHWIAWLTELMWEVCRVLRPGAHGFVWAIPRNSHWTATALEDAGFEIRDIVHHLYGQGMPKSLDVGKAIDKLAGAERQVVGRGHHGRSAGHGVSGDFGHKTDYFESKDGLPITAPATDAAKQWDGWGTALKPACEHWILIRKPLAETSITRNVLRYGTGGLNIDACRVERAAEDVPGWHKSGSYGRTEGYLGESTFKIRDMPPEEVQDRCGDKGRWPPNALLSPESAAALDARLGPRPSGKMKAGTVRKNRDGYTGPMPAVTGADTYGDSGGPSRYFPAYFPKPSRAEREAGLDAIEPALLNRVNPGGLEHEPRFAPIAVKNNHPTVKGLALMQYLCRLCCPPDGLILDPFMGSGTTGCAAVLNGQRFIGIEQDERYVAISEARIAHWSASRTGDPAP